MDQDHEQDVKPKRGRGRPRKELNGEQIERMARILCTDEEIASVLGCCVETLKNYSERLKRGRDLGRESLRRLQWKSAQRGSATMQIWLGKQWLGQSDKQEIKSDNRVGVEYLNDWQAAHDDPSAAAASRPANGDAGSPAV